MFSYSYWLIGFGKPTSGSSLRYLTSPSADIMEPRSNTCNTSCSFSIDNILSDKREEEPTNLQFELQANSAEFVRPSFQMFPPFLYGGMNTWPHYPPHGCSPFDRSRKTTGKWSENNFTLDIRHQVNKHWYLLHLRFTYKLSECPPCVLTNLSKQPACKWSD